MEHCSAIKKDEMLPFATAWMDPESIVSEVSQMEKDENNMISIIGGIQKKHQMNKQTSK